MRDQAFRELGYAVVETLPLTEAQEKSFNNLPRDTYSLERHRGARLSQYLLFHEEGGWVFALLPKRGYVQPKKYIRLDGVGGVARHREQLEIDPSAFVNSILIQMPLDRATNYHVNVHQFRVSCNGRFRGISVPEGPHRDGHEFSVIAVSKRRNITGGETQIISPSSGEVVFRTTLKENTAIIIDDERYIHYATNIEEDGAEEGYRDLWVVEVNEWRNRKYGAAHDRMALEGSS